MNFITMGFLCRIDGAGGWSSALSTARTLSARCFTVHSEVFFSARFRGVLLFRGVPCAAFQYLCGVCRGRRLYSAGRHASENGDTAIRLAGWLVMPSTVPVAELTRLTCIASIPTPV
jgi:hypothetical protein